MLRSLVGSEMCIRDRSVTLSASAQTPTIDAAMAGNTYIAQPDGPGDVGAVSYTHLTLPTIYSV